MAYCFPSFGCGMLPNPQIITPLVYDESQSYQQQLACLMGQMNKLSNKVDMYVLDSVFQDFIKFMENNQNQQTSDLEKYTDKQILELKTYLISLIDAISAAMDIWDVTLGKFNNNVDSMRDLFNDVTVHAITVDTLADSGYTVDTLAECGLNVRGLAIYSGTLIGEEFVPEGIFYVPPTEPTTIKLTTQMLGTALVNDDGVFVESTRWIPSAKLTSEQLADAQVDENGVIRRGDA